MMRETLGKIVSEATFTCPTVHLLVTFHDVDGSSFYFIFIKCRDGRVVVKCRSFHLSPFTSHQFPIPMTNTNGTLLLHR